MGQEEDLVAKLKREAEDSYDAAVNKIDKLMQYLAQYKSCTSDLSDAKLKYSSTVSKYSQNIGISVSTFPGVTVQPAMSSEEMQMDSRELEGLGEIVAQLEDHKVIIQDEMNNMIQAIINNTRSMTTSTNQALLFIDNIL